MILRGDEWALRRTGSGVIVGDKSLSGCGMTFSPLSCDKRQSSQVEETPVRGFMAFEFLLENLSLDTRGEFRESLFLHLRFFKCLQFKTISISEQHMLGCMSSTPTVMLWGGRFCSLRHHEVEEADFWANLCSLIQRCRRIRASLQPPGVTR